MDPQFGILNAVLTALGFDPLDWMLSEKTSLLSIIIVSIWKSLGYNVLIVTSGLQNIPQDILNPRSSTAPTGSAPSSDHGTDAFADLRLSGHTTIIGTFSTYDLIKLMTQGGPRNSSNLLVYWIYETGYLQFNVGKAMAGGVILLLFIGTVSVANFTLMNKRAHYQ